MIQMLAKLPSGSNDVPDFGEVDVVSRVNFMSCVLFHDFLQKRVVAQYAEAKVKYASGEAAEAIRLLKSALDISGNCQDPIVAKVTCALSLFDTTVDEGIRFCYAAGCADARALLNEWCPTESLAYAVELLQDNPMTQGVPFEQIEKAAKLIDNTKTKVPNAVIEDWRMHFVFFN